MSETNDQLQPKWKDPNEWTCPNCDMIWTWPFCGACGHPAIIKVQQPIDVAEARAHLGAALMQTIDKDSPIIMGHVRDAYLLLGGRP